MLSGLDPERDELSVIVRRVIERYLRSREKKRGPKTLVVFTDWVSGIDEAIEYCDEQFDPKLTDYLLEKSYPGVNRLGAIFRVGKEEDERILIDQLGKYDRLVVLSPTIRTLRAVASGVPTALTDRAALQLILARAEVRFLLSFNPAELPTGRFTTDLRRLIEDVADMGVRFEFGYGDEPAAEEGKILITAETVDAYARENRRVIHADSKTIVTPLAEERADELHIRILK